MAVSEELRAAIKQELAKLAQEFKDNLEEIRKLQERNREIKTSTRAFGFLIGEKTSGDLSLGPKGRRMKRWKESPLNCFLSAKYHKPGQNKKASTRGLCTAHYTRWRANTLTPEENKEYDTALDKWRAEGKMY